MITPCHLEILLHYYVSPEPHPRFDAPAVQEYICWLLNNGILEQRELKSYRVTEKGDAWIEAMLSTPLPIAKWVVPSKSA